MAKDRSRLILIYNIAVLVLLVVAVGYTVADFYLNGDSINSATSQAIAQQAYQRGIQDTQTLVTQEIIKQLNEQGYVEVRVPTSDGQTATIRLGIIQPNQ